MQYKCIFPQVENIQTVLLATVPGGIGKLHSTHGGDNREINRGKEISPEATLLFLTPGKA
jgi:hypothetical protein